MGLSGPVGNPSRDRDPSSSFAPVQLPGLPGRSNEDLVDRQALSARFDVSGLGIAKTPDKT
jgi:hypothetical protein